MTRKPSQPAATVSDTDFDRYLGFALSLAEPAGKIALAHYRRPINVENKNLALGEAGFDPVTAADKGVEEHIRREIERRFPDHGIVGEEYGSSNAGSDFQWIIDPIDGTRAFMMGMPSWGTLIGLTHKGAPLLGLMSQPFTGEVFWSARDKALTRGPLGELSLKTRPCAGLKEAVLGCTHPSLFKTKDELKRFDALAERVRMMRYGGDCYLYCLLAAGFVDLILEANLKSFDVAALVPIIVRAGGIITQWDGGPAHHGGQIIAAGDKRVYDAAMAALTA